MIWWQRVIEASPYLLVVFAFVMIKILRVFTTHQQKMAEIVNRSSADHTEVSALRQEIAELKSLMHQQVINADDRRAMDTPPVAPSVAERLGNGR
jgi:hypothetical protein